MVLLCSLSLHHIDVSTERPGLRIGVLVGLRIYICVVIFALENAAVTFKLIVRLSEIVIPLILSMIICW